jgi:hypothetical protein
VQTGAEGRKGRLPSGLAAAALSAQSGRLSGAGRLAAALSADLASGLAQEQGAGLGRQAQEQQQREGGEDASVEGHGKA